VECDDGNNKNGDGCNELCKIEDGFKCMKSENGPDYCFDNKAPEAKLRIYKGNLICLEFSEDVYSFLKCIFAN